jgi:hypothetical protein
MDSLGDLNVVGQVMNAGTQTSRFTKVIATFYNKAGKVIYVEFDYTSPSDIPAGQTYGFKIIGPSTPISGQVGSFSIFAESDQYFSTPVPEMSWPTLIAAIALVLSVVLMRKSVKSAHA